MSKETERVVLTQHFKTLVDEEFGSRVSWPNKPFQTPQRAMFLDVHIVDLAPVRMGLGYNFFKRHYGVFQVDIYTPQDEGTQRSRQLVDIWSNEYEMLELPTTDGERIIFRNPSSRELDTNVIRAANLDDNWSRYLFEAPFYRDQLVEK